MKIEDKYKKLSQREHVLQRPGMYIGSVKKQIEELWVPKDENGSFKMEKTMVEYSPGFMKIFDEVLTNATDHSFRDSTVTTIKVEYCKESGELSVWNNGSGIPIQLHKEHNIYVPELIFGYLLSGSNYNDNNTRTGAGTNGLGSKCHLHSTKIPLFNGEIKKASEINVGDILIGDDGTPRTVLNKTEGFGEMYEIIQNYGENYIVNNNHTLTLHMPDHKVIFWNTNGWSSIWWNNDKKCIETKFIKVFNNTIKCPECNIELNSRLSRHYKRKHKNTKLPKFTRKSPTYGDLKNQIVKEKYEEMKKFLEEIPYNSIFDINIQDYLKLNKTIQRRLAGVRGECVQWPDKEVELDPYILGLWLGDGMKDGRQYACFGEKDPEIINYFEDWCEENDAIIEQKLYNKYTYGLHSKSKFGKKNSSPLRNILKKYNLINNKHIPKEYLINSRDIRIKLLAGIIDTDGTVIRDGTRIIITQSHIHKRLIDDIVYLVRSLGFFCCVNSYMAKYKLENGEEKESLAYKVNISGNIDDIPTLLPRKKCKKTKRQNTDKSTGYIKINKVKNNKYVGFETDGNQRFVINDFTVTHNCTNIFSKKFIIETIDSEEKKKFIQEYSENMTQKTKAKITKNSGKSYTKITFIPDYERFGMKGLEDDTILLIRKRVLDCIAFTNNIQIYLNGEKLKGKGLVDYTKYFFESEKVISESHIEKYKNKNGEVIEYIWEYAIVPYSQYEQVSFVNGNSTIQGGKHVDYIMYQIINKYKKMLEEKKKLKELKPNFIKDKIFLFLRSTVSNPSFNSQTKEQLTTPSKDFGCTIVVSDQFINKLYKSKITDDIVEFCKIKESVDLSKSTNGKKVNKLYIPKLEDAHFAGTTKSSKCTLILTEGDSAKTFAMWGRTVIGSDYFGVFSLKGKIINIRDASSSQLLNNEELNNIKKIIGLQHGKKYTSLEELRYGKVMLLMDADCVTGDTPLLLRDYDNNIFTDTIDRLTNKYTKNIINNKEYGNTDYEVWTEKGWTRIKLIIRHKVSKTFYRVLTHTGVIDVSEDHPLLTNDGQEKTPINCLVNDKLLHSFPILDENKIDIPNNMEYLKIEELRKYARKCKIPYYQRYKKMDLIKELQKVKQQNAIKLNNITNINKEEAYVMGLFWADGSSGIYNWKYNYKPVNRPNEYTYNRITYSWAISNNNIDYLRKSKEILEKLYNLEFKIIECTTKRQNKSYKLIINGGIKTKDIVEKYTELFYYRNNSRYKNGNKYIPKQILNASKEIREQFLIGYYNGDGYGHDINNNKVLRFDVESKISAQSLFILCKSLNYEVSINVLENKPNIISLILTKGYQQCDKNKIKKIIKLGKIDSYVYDLETENHHFQGGVGQMIVHNCDGSHIKNLFINFIHYYWPELLKIDFIQSLRTPIVKIFAKNKNLEFYTEQEYNKWKNNNDIKNLKIKYYKGLGTSQKDDAKQIFSRINELMINYYYKNKQCEESILLAFSKDKDISANKRKEWLKEYDKDVYLDLTQKNISYSDLINKELIHFSNYDNIRSIPQLMDGLKPSQRKILYYMLSNNITKSIKVAQLSGYVSAETSYHHGEASLQQAIITMSQDFIGTNNINLLYPDGNHGCLSPYTKVVTTKGVKYAKDICKGDLLQGDDMKIRKVLETTRGKDIMYKIYYDKNKYYIVNSQHILTLTYKINKINKKYKNNKIDLTIFDSESLKEKIIDTQKINVKDIINKYKKVDIKVEDYLKLPVYLKVKFTNTYYDNILEWKTNNKKTIPPYIYGNWYLSHINSYVLKIKNIESYNQWKTYCKNNNINMLQYYKTCTYKLCSKWIDKINIKEKQYNNIIPPEYIYTSLSDRLDFILGLTDSPKTSIKNGWYKIELYDKNKFKSIINLLKTFVNTYLQFKTKVEKNRFNFYKYYIYINITKKKKLTNKICKIEEIGIDDYVGFEIDGNKRFIIETSNKDYIVTHNSRLLGGKDAASPRYIYTYLNGITKNIFDKNDDNLLEYKEDDGLKVEPEFYVPVIPMILVNGCEGIGTGYSTFIPQCNPKDIIENIKLKIKNKKLKELKPWYKNFKGDIVKKEDNKYIINGKWERKNKTIVITELPIGVWITQYKEYIEKKIKDENASVITDIKNMSLDENTNIKIVITFKSDDILDKLIENNELETLLKLTKTQSHNNMYLFNNKSLKKYNSLNEILLDFYDKRLEFYKLRKQNCINILKNELIILEQKSKFVADFINEKIIIIKKEINEIDKQLENNNYIKVDNTYDYLTNMSLRSLTKNKIDELNKSINNKRYELDKLNNSTEYDLWLEDLDKLEKLI